MSIGKHIGSKIWAIPEGYIPSFRHSPKGTGNTLVSHETACLLNTGPKEAHVRITLYFKDRPPVGPYEVIIPAERTLHLRFNDLKSPMPVPRGTD